MPFVIDFLLFAGGGLVELWGDTKGAEGPLETASSFRGAAPLAGCCANCCFPFCPCPTTTLSPPCSCSFLLRDNKIKLCIHPDLRLTCSSWPWTCRFLLLGCLSEFWDHRHGSPYPLTTPFRFVSSVGFCCLLFHVVVLRQNLIL